MDGKDIFMNTTEAAGYLRLKEQSLVQRRCQKLGPPFFKVGRLVRYRKSDLDKWISRNTHNVDAA